MPSTKTASQHCSVLNTCTSKYMSAYACDAHPVPPGYISTINTHNTPEVPQHSKTSRCVASIPSHSDLAISHLPCLGVHQWSHSLALGALQIISSQSCPIAVGAPSPNSLLSVHSGAVGCLHRDPSSPTLPSGRDRCNTLLGESCQAETTTGTHNNTAALIVAVRVWVVA